MARDVHYGIHVCHLSEEVDGDDGFSAGSNGSRQLSGVHRVALLIDIDKDRFCSAISDGLGRRHEGARDSYDFIALTDAEGEKSEPQGVRAIAIGADMFDATELGKLFFKPFHVGTASESTAVNYLVYRSPQLGPDGFVMEVEIKKWNLH
jgi:hypothetical protein